MRKILITALFILVAGCNTRSIDPDTNAPPHARPNTHASRASVTKKVQASKIQHSIYDRYKNKGHRYAIFQDGAPKKQNKVNFKEPVPAKEPLSRYGNPVEYKVDGRNYEVLKSSSGYKTSGVASWYGTKFHKQRTSSGEPYDMYIMSAAHKTLPLPTYIKVKNLDNGRVAVVKVNDRGPFHSDRVLDLSYAAALKLGVFPKGTARVEIETLMGPAGQAHYYLQAGAFSTEASAKNLKDKLNHISTSPVFVEHYKQFYVVRAGPFADKGMVDHLKQQLVRNGVTGSFSILI